MPSLTSALQVAISGIQTSQLGLSTVSHNITNADSEGYHRQSIEYSAVSYNGFGSGVQLESIQRQVDEFLEERVTGQISTKGYTSEFLSAMENLESIFGDPTDQGNSSLDKIFNDFFESLNSLANDPDSSAQKSATIQKGVLLADTIQSINSDLTTMQAQADADIDESIENVNVILKNIYELNKEIALQETAGVSGANANDLRDQRQEQVELLATYMNIQVNEDSSGGLSILSGNGRSLVDSTTYSQMERTSDTPYDGIGIRRVKVDGSLSSTMLELDSSRLTGGSMKALIDVRDNVVPDMISELDNLTNTFKSEFNRLHSQGTSYPPVNALTSGSTQNVTSAVSDIYAELDPALAGSSFNISVVDSTGDTVYTTVNTGLPITGTGAISLPGAGPFSLQDLADLINTNTDIGNTALGGTDGVTASVGLDTNGNSVITIAAADTNLRVVMSNENGDVLGSLGMNTFFTGTGSSDIAVKDSIVSDPSLIAFGQMRMSDGGLSSLNNDNAIQLAAMGEKSLSFSSAGGLNSMTDTVTGYTNQMLANLALNIADAEDRNTYASTVLSEMEQSVSEISGVSIDEELANMLIYQHAFQASSRILSTVDELLQTLINTVA